jgi:hypothetical protein
MPNDDHEPVTGRTSTPADDQLRDLALQRLRKQSEFRIFLVFYLAVNGTVVVVWAWSGAALFWPIFSIVAWSIWLALNAWDAYGRRPISEDRIDREMRRLQR